MTDGRQDPKGSALERLRAALERESSDSLTLLKDLENNPICVVCDESVPCVSVTWRRYATSRQLRFVHEKVMHIPYMTDNKKKITARTPTT